MGQDKQDGLALILFAVLCVALYFNSLWGIFLFDDLHTIPDNLLIKDSRYIPLFFKGYYTSETHIPHGMFRPLLMLTFVFNYAFSRLQPLGYHIVNMLLHFLNVILLYCLLRLLKKSLPFGLALLVSLLFLSHPVNTEAVTYISARSDLMACFFVLLGFICHIQGKRILAVIMFILGLLSKETALVLPFLILGYDFLGVSRISLPEPGRIFRDKRIFYIAIIAISAIYWLYRQHLYGSTLVVLSDTYRSVRNPYSNTLIQLAVTVYYLRLFIFPYPLSIHHDFPALNSIFHPLAFFSVGAIIVMVLFIFFLRKKQFLISFGLAWYFICLLPKFYSPLNIVAAEHHLYMPSIGIYLILAVLFEGAYFRFRRKFIIGAIGIISLFSVLVWLRNYEYSDDYVFWRKAIETNYSSPVHHHNLGMAYVRKGFYEEAEREFKTVLLIAPVSAKRVRVNALDSLSNAYRLQKKYKKALASLNKIIELKLDTFGTYQNLGVVYLDMGQEEKAVGMWEKGLALNPYASGILINLGLHYLRNFQFSRAKRYFEGAVKYDPDSSVAFFGLGRILQEEGQTDAAISAYAKSAQLKPGYAFTHYYLGQLYMAKSDPRAFNEFKEAVRLEPDLAEAHNNLSVFYAAMQPPQLELAREHARKAISLGYKVDKKFLEIINLSATQEKGGSHN